MKREKHAKNERSNGKSNGTIRKGTKNACRRSEGGKEKWSRESKRRSGERKSRRVKREKSNGASERIKKREKRGNDTRECNDGSDSKRSEKEMETRRK